MASRSDNVFNAKLAEQAERYDDMVKFMKKIAESGSLEVEERNLLSVAYKNIVGARRAAWRVITSLLTTDGRAPMEVEVLKRYRDKVEGELRMMCDEILGLLKDTLVPNSTKPEEKVFYLKMAGDYYRYLSEFANPDEASSEDAGAVMNAKKYYNEATEVALDGTLPKTNPILLGLILNMSVFYYEILNEPAEACRLAKNGFDQAVDELDALEEESYKDATLIMQLLRDNLTLWTSDDTNTYADGDGEVEDM